MRVRVLNLALLGALVVLVGLNWFFRINLTQPNYEYFPDMAHSPAYAAFSANPNFPDRKTLQAPPEGTLARGEAALHYRATPEDALRAAGELHNPLPAGDAASLGRGRFVLLNFCAVCHSAAGSGNGPVIARGYPAPPSLLAEKTMKMKDGQLFHVLTYGQGNMPSYASQVALEDRWRVVTYVRYLQEQNQIREQRKAAAAALAAAKSIPPSGSTGSAGPEAGAPSTGVKRP